MSLRNENVLFGLAWALALTGCASTPSDADVEEGFREFVSIVAESLELESRMESTSADDFGSPRASFIMLTLASTSEHAAHNLNGATGNEVWTHVDGHQEGVYDADGNLVEDCANQASYNYFSPWEEALNHFTYDTLPWIYLGNCDEDPTTREERIAAFFMDLRGGVDRILAQGYPAIKLPPEHCDQQGERLALSLFLKVFESDPALAPESLPASVDSPVGKARITDFMTRFEDVFRDLLSEIPNPEYFNR